MPEPVTWTSGKRSWKKPLTRRQRRCSNPPPVPATQTRGVPEGTSPLRRRRKTPVERISPPTPFLLTHLVENSSLPLSRLPLPIRRRTKTTSKEVLGAEGADKDRAAAMTLLQRMLTLAPSREKWKMFSKSSTTTVTGRDITPPSVSRGQKTNVSFGNIHAGDWN